MELLLVVTHFPALSRKLDFIGVCLYLFVLLFVDLFFDDFFELLTCQFDSVLFTQIGPFHYLLKDFRAIVLLELVGSHLLELLLGNFPDVLDCLFHVDLKALLLLHLDLCLDPVLLFFPSSILLIALRISFMLPEELFFNFCDVIQKDIHLAIIESTISVCQISSKTWKQEFVDEDDSVDSSLSDAQ